VRYLTCNVRWRIVYFYRRKSAQLKQFNDFLGNKERRLNIYFKNMCNMKPEIKSMNFQHFSLFCCSFSRFFLHFFSSSVFLCRSLVSNSHTHIATVCQRAKRTENKLTTERCKNKSSSSSWIISFLCLFLTRNNIGPVRKIDDDDYIFTLRFRRACIYFDNFSTSTTATTNKNSARVH
jgi:hypothetical protein